MTAARRRRDPTIKRDPSSHLNRWGDPKVSHLSEAEALAAADHAGARHRRPPPGVYRCAVCAWWHVGGER